MKARKRPLILMAHAVNQESLILMPVPQVPHRNKSILGLGESMRRMVSIPLKDETHKCVERNCRTKFSVRSGSIFETSHIPLKKWFMAIYLATSHKKGISSCQLARDIGVTQKTAWFVIHRINEAASNKGCAMVPAHLRQDSQYCRLSAGARLQPRSSAVISPCGIGLPVR